MTSSRFDSGSILKTLNLSFLRFNERSGFENLDLNIFFVVWIFFQSPLTKVDFNSTKPALFMKWQWKFSKGKEKAMVLIFGC